MNWIVKVQRNKLEEDIEIRCFQAKRETLNFECVTKNVIRLFPDLKFPSFSLAWEDEDKDLVMFSTDEELEVALARNEERKRIKVIIKVSKSSSGSEAQARLPEEHANPREDIHRPPSPLPGPSGKTKYTERTVLRLYLGIHTYEGADRVRGRMGAGRGAGGWRKRFDGRFIRIGRERVPAEGLATFNLQHLETPLSKICVVTNIRFETPSNRGEKRKAVLNKGNKDDEVLQAGETHNEQNDEDRPCDVCMSPIPETDNEMVYCGKCDVLVHQACYGISKLPEGDWLCKVCESGRKEVTCILCNKTGGAMKCTSDGKKWAHIMCVWWIPETRMIGNKKLGPIVGIEEINEKRWKLKCQICKEREGACIQCDIPSCYYLFHVRCGSTRNLLL